MDQQDKAFMMVFSAVLGILVLIAVFIFILAHWIVDEDSASLDAFRMEQAAKRLEQPGRVVISGTPEAEQEQASAAAAMPTAGSGVADTAAVDGGAIYQNVCAACHTAGVLNAPKLGDNLEWMTRYQKGLDTLLRHSAQGFNQMPAQSPTVPEDSVKAAILYMLSESGVAVEEPAVAQSTEAQASEQAAATETASTATQAASTEAQTAAMETTTTETASTQAQATTTEAPTQAAATETPAAETQAAATETAAAETQAATTEAAPAAETQAATTEAVPAETQVATTETTAAAETQPVAASAAGSEAAPDTAGAIMPADLDLVQGQQIYENVCRFCHMGTIPTAPAFGDKEAWAPRIARGWDALKASTLNGTTKGMLPKGGRSDLSDEQVLNALGYMISNSQ